MNKHQVPEVAGIDLDFTPTSYFRERDLGLALPSDIMGQARRQIARQLVADGEDPPPELLVPTLTEEGRRAIGRIHPVCMGGEYLPRLADGEVEVARISLRSVTADQISVRARRTLGRISYRIVDEYGDSSFMTFTVRPDTSILPLSMCELVAMLDGACERGGAVMGHPVGLIEEAGEPAGELRHFVSVESDFYPDLGSYYEARLDAYFASLPCEDENEEEE